MAILEKKYTYEKGNDNIYNIDTYNTDPTKKALEISDSNNVRFKNLSDNRNTDNFYGDGRLGSFDKRDTNPVTIKCCYFYEVRNHDIYGWCLWKQWYNATSNFQIDDEVILYKKHIEKEEYLNELGDWEIVTIKEIITDVDGVHYVIDRAPTYEWSTRTCNSATLVQQFTTLNVFEGNDYREEITAYSYTSTPAGLWSVGRVRISLPNGIVFIKASKEIIIGKNAYIGAKYGYNGAHAYAYISTLNTLCDASGPRGGGVFEGAKQVTTSLRDIRSPGGGRPALNYYSTNYAADINTYINYGYNGGFVDGRNGINHTQDTLFGNNYGIDSVDLNRKLYYGIGTTALQFGNTYTSTGGDWHSFDTYGRSGGGILIIQTPKITFVNKNSKLYAGESSMGTRLATGYGNGGSMLIKAEELVFNENPEQLKTYSGKSSSSEVDYANTTYSFGTTALDATRNHWISNPGLIQIDFDRWKTNYDNQTYTKDTLPIEVKKNHIFDYKTQYVKELRGLMGTLVEWDSSNSLKYNTHGNSAPVFESGSWFKLYTKGFNNININEWEDLVKIFTSYTLPEGTEIKIAFSTTAGNTWFYFNNIKTNPTVVSLNLTQTDLNTKGNSVADLNEFTSSFLLTNTFLFSQADKDVKTIDVCIAMKTTKSHISPLMNYIWFDYNKISTISSPIPIRPFNGEEFENEYVNFVWLQPESRRGSVQNRLEINDVPSFSQDYKNIKAIPTDTSSSAGKIHLPFQGNDYSDYINVCKNFKLPYLKRRYSPVTFQGEENLPSIKLENGKIKYPGGDIYFRKGNTVQLLSQPDLSLPSTKYTLKNITVPREENLISHFDFTGLADFSKNSIIKDIKNNNVFDFNSSYIDTGLTQLENNILHGNTVSYTGKSKSSIVLNGTGLNETILNSNKDTTIMLRFMATDLVMNDWNGLLHINTTNNQHISIIEIYPYMDNGSKYYRFRNYTHAVEQYTDVLGFEEGSENVLTLVISKNNINYLYLNGILISTHTRYIGSGNIRIELGARTLISPIPCGLNGQILEFGIWNVALNTNEIKEISKVSHWHLRYDFSDNKLRWYQVPYNNHLKHYKYIKDEVNYVNMRPNTYFKGVLQGFVGGNGECYYNYHDTLLMGKYKPSRSTLNAFNVETGVFRPMQTIPFITKRFATPVNNYKSIEYFDNNSFNYKTGTATEYFIAHGRYSLTNNYSLSFMYNGSQANGYSNIGLIRGALSGTESLTPYPSMVFYIIYGGSPSYEVYVINTGGSWVKTLSGNFPYDLKDNNIYEVQFISEEGFNNTKCIFKSSTDDSYKMGLTIGNITSAPTKGYLSDNYNDMVYLSSGASFEEIGFLMRCENKSAFQLIDVCSFDINSVKTQEAGFLSKYEIYQNISKGTLKKLNNIKIGSFTNNPGADIRTFMSFNNGVTYKIYNYDTKTWVAVNPEIPSNGMEVKDVIGLTTYDFNNSGGLISPFDNVVFRFVLFNSNSNSTILLDKIDISYNGPMIIDSWKELGSFYNGTQFYYSENGWSPFVEPDFNDVSQNWKVMGSDIPSPVKLTPTNGAKPSYAEKKVFSGARVLLNPKGKYYWRVASYNGL